MLRQLEQIALIYDNWFSHGASLLWPCIENKHNTSAYQGKKLGTGIRRQYSPTRTIVIQILNISDDPAEVLKTFPVTTHWLSASRVKLTLWFHVNFLCNIDAFSM
jgi:hypothetical protein